MLFLDRRTLQLPRLWPQTWSHDKSGSSYIRLSVCLCVSTTLQCNSPTNSQSTNNKDDPCQLPICTHFPFFYFYSVLLSTLWSFLSTDMTRKWNWQLCFVFFKLSTQTQDSKCGNSITLHIKTKSIHHLNIIPAFNILYNLTLTLCRVHPKYILCTVRNTVQAADKGQWAT